MLREENWRLTDERKRAAATVFDVIESTSCCFGSFAFILYLLPFLQYCANRCCTSRPAQAVDINRSLPTTTIVYMHLLDLPAELILRCVSMLTIRDLASLYKLGNRAVFDLLSTCPSVQYYIEQHRAGVRGNARMFPLAKPIAELREALQLRQSRWLSFSPSSRQTIAIASPWDDVALFSVGDDSYSCAERTSSSGELATRLRYFYTRPSTHLTWTPLDTTGDILDQCVVAELDLMVILQLSISASEQVFVAHLRSISANGPHPMASVSPLHVATVPATHGIPESRVRISSSILAISLLFVEVEGCEHDCLHVFDWKRGEIISSKWLPGLAPTTALVFLDLSHILLADPPRKAFTVSISTRSSGPSRVSLLIPPLQPGWFSDLYSAQISGRPHIHGAGERDAVASHGDLSTACFLTDPEVGLILLSYDLGSSFPRVERGEDGPIARIVFLVDRRALLQLVRDAVLGYPESKECVQVPFAEWGPVCCRWFDATAMAESSPSSTFGRRIVSVDRTGIDGGGTRPVRIWDFNLETVRHVRRLLSEAGTDVLELNDAIISIVDCGAPMPAPWRLDMLVNTEESQLPFVQIVSRELFNYSAVHANNNSIIGAKAIMRDEVEYRELEVLHFG
ncbi:hypothetical protein MKEN_00987800 [Mycena kentingensis (nom. inval.)]|nr:hypothetical protein MKEN_00987800 [Mycena kentingensis (nom. inval.)]